jgi:hypothetical protein
MARDDLFMTMSDLSLAPTNDTADLKFGADLYQCKTTVCAQDFVPPGFPANELYPVYGTFVETPEPSTAWLLLAGLSLCLFLHRPFHRQSAMLQ